MDRRTFLKVVGAGLAMPGSAIQAFMMRAPSIPAIVEEVIREERVEKKLIAIREGIIEGMISVDQGRRKAKEVIGRTIARAAIRSYVRIPEFQQELNRCIKLSI